MDRRQFIKDVSISAAAMAASGFARPLGLKVPSSFGAPYLRNNAVADKVIILGMDGMDPVLLKRCIDAGYMPAFEKLAKSGYFGELETAMPPQSPVAWASFITGTNPGGHGIFDFVHRDPSSFTPYLSTSRSFDVKHSMGLGGWRLPLGSGEVKLMRRGTLFWSVLEENGIPASVFQIPANFPVQPSSSLAISGMGTPDLLGTYGTFSFITDANVSAPEQFAGGRVLKVKAANHRFEARLEGPANPYRTAGESTSVTVTIRRDPSEQVAKISVQDQTLILRQGEWSDWIPLNFDLIPYLSSVGGMARFYLQEVHPKLKLYVSPINIDPLNPTLPISSPVSYSRELAERIGRFYTQGFPADTKALSTGFFSNEEYIAQAKLVLEESLRAFEVQLNDFREGCFFFYFSSLDQNSHMLWRLMDESHPLYEKAASDDVKNAVRWFYQKMDEVLAKAMTKVDSRTTLMVLSDHGFAPFTREFHLSTWLAENGYTAVTNKKKLHESEFFDYVDWGKTNAYALGINSIYLNLTGREKDGSCSSEKAQSIKQQIKSKLQQVIDPLTGEQVIRKVYEPSEIYSGSYLPFAPDLIVGYNRGYRISDESVIGKFPKGIIGDRKDKWSADHCMDSSVVPGALLTNRPWLNPKPAIWDLAPTILKAFGLSAPPEMTGKALL